MRTRIVIALSMLLTIPPLAEAASSSSAGPTPTATTSSPVRTIQQSLDSISREIERPKTRPTDPGPVGGGGGINGPLGRTCAEARERMRWSDLPCSPFMPAE